MSPRLALLSLLAATATAALLAPVARAGDPTFRKVDINPKSAFEAAGAMDIDGDGDLDILSGGFWYEAPDWVAHRVRDVPKVGTYYNDFATVPMDVDGDGDLDAVTCSYFGKDVAWIENPGTTDADWTLHPIDTPGPSETGVGVDLTGDGKPEFLPNTVNTVVFYELQKAGKEPKFRKYDFGTAAAGHGVGTGDVNGDGRVDLLTPKGWFESPANPTADTWPWHPDWTLDGGPALKDLRPGIQILARDLTGDGLPDVVYGMGHNRGLFWIEQGKAPDGARTWSAPKVIDAKVTSVHTLLWADLDGDGDPAELITGKRVYAHEKEEGDTEGSLVAWYRFDKKAGTWSRHPIYEGQDAVNAPAEIAQRDAQVDFPCGTAGVGLQVTAIDIDADGDIDLICPGKSGLYLFENQLKGRPAKSP